MKFLTPRFGAFNKIQPRYEKLKKHGQEWLRGGCVSGKPQVPPDSVSFSFWAGAGWGRKEAPGKPQTGDSSSINAAGGAWLRIDDPRGSPGARGPLLEKRRLEPGKGRLKPGDPTEWWGLLSAGELGGARSDTRCSGGQTPESSFMAQVQRGLCSLWRLRLSREPIAEPL